MGQRLYDSATAEALMKFAYPEYGVHELKPYEIKENGVYTTSAFRDLCQPGTVFNWTPADEMGWPGSPNPDTAPFLPIPFDAAQLAAAMIDGAGRSIAYSMEHRLGYPLDDDALNRFSDRMRWMRDALAEAYQVAAAAQLVVGEFDHQAEASAYALAGQYEDAADAANEREGVFAPDVSEDERRTRRDRAVASVLPLQVALDSAMDASAKEWRQWRTAMVRQLLNPATPEAAAAQLQANAPAPVMAESASTAPGNGKVWTPERLADAKAYREKHGTKKTAELFGVSEQLIRQKLPSEKPIPKGYSAFTHRLK